MNLLELAHIYTDLVNAEQEIPDEEYRAKDSINALRTKYHQMLIDKMREENIEFYDRFDVTRIAFDLVKERDNYASKTSQ